MSDKHEFTQRLSRIKAQGPAPVTSSAHPGSEPAAGAVDPASPVRRRRRRDYTGRVTLSLFTVICVVTVLVASLITGEGSRLTEDVLQLAMAYLN